MLLPEACLSADSHWLLFSVLKQWPPAQPHSHQISAGCLDAKRARFCHVRKTNQTMSVNTATRPQTHATWGDAFSCL